MRGEREQGLSHSDDELRFRSRVRHRRTEVVMSINCKLFQFGDNTGVLSAAPSARRPFEQRFEGINALSGFMLMTRGLQNLAALSDRIIVLSGPYLLSGLADEREPTFEVFALARSVLNLQDLELTAAGRSEKIKPRFSRNQQLNVRDLAVQPPLGGHEHWPQRHKEPRGSSVSAAFNLFQSPGIEIAAARHDSFSAGTRRLDGTSITAP